MVRENQLKQLHFRTTTCLKLSWPECWAGTVSQSLTHFPLQSLLCFPREPNAPRLNAVHQPWDMPCILQPVVSRKTALIKVNTGVWSNDNLTYSLLLGWIPRWNVLMQRIINLSPGNPSSSSPSADTQERQWGCTSLTIQSRITPAPAHPACMERGPQPRACKAEGIWDLIKGLRVHLTILFHKQDNHG